MEGRTSLHHFLHYFLNHHSCGGFKWQPSSSYNTYASRWLSFFSLMNRCHAVINSVVTSRDSCKCQPHPSIGVWGRVFLNTEEIEPFFCRCFGALAQVGSWLYQPPPLAIQLSLKDSSCAVLDRTEGPLCAPAHRGTTVTAPKTL